MVHGQHIKNEIIKAHEYSSEVWKPQIKKGSLEFLLRFLAMIKKAMDDMGFEDKPVDTCREFRAHTRGKVLSRFSTKHNGIVTYVLTSDNIKEISKHAIIGLGKTNRLKGIRRHMVTVSNPHGA